MSFADEQRRRRAAGAVGTADLLDRIAARNPVLAELGSWIVDAPVGAPTPTDPIAVAAEIRGAIAALKMLNARRELGQITAFLRDDPDHASAPAWRARAVELASAVAALERSGAVGPRPWGAILAREGRSPPRRAWPAAPDATSARALQRLRPRPTTTTGRPGTRP